ncbi:hypothetical protein DN051_01480 [Streptomyces cadmiisoli]|uniref:Uncharacterized protein n=2 Tax=Streptomyces cadmiisoli TaxID=2184053 RepID=A0A2Z4IRV9_9ACTN|nr:hypothetical protein DN051_01480 [Streptomyces cadmiisoli]
MRMKTFVRAASTAALLAAVSATLTPSASASEVGTAATTINYPQAQASYDNNPGNGRESWLWASNWGSSKIRIDAQHYDNSISYDLVVEPNQARSVNFNKDIWRIRYCWFDSRVNYWGCHGWS